VHAYKTGKCVISDRSAVLSPRGRKNTAVFQYFSAKLHTLTLTKQHGFFLIKVHGLQQEEYAKQRTDKIDHTPAISVCTKPVLVFSAADIRPRMD